MLILLKRAMKVSVRGEKLCFLIPVSPHFKVTSVSSINTAPCAVGWRVLPGQCQILIPFLMLIIIVSPKVVIWSFSFLRCYLQKDVKEANAF